MIQVSTRRLAIVIIVICLAVIATNYQSYRLGYNTTEGNRADEVAGLVRRQAEYFRQYRKIIELQQENGRLKIENGRLLRVLSLGAGQEMSQQEMLKQEALNHHKALEQRNKPFE